MRNGKAPSRGRPGEQAASVPLTLPMIKRLIGLIDGDADRRDRPQMEAAYLGQIRKRLFDAECRAKGAPRRRRRRSTKTCPIETCTVYPSGTCDSCPDWEVA